MDKFTVRLQGLLEDKGMSQRELAELAGVTEVTISRYVSGNRKPRIEIVNKIAEVLNTTTDYLLGRTDIKHPYLKNNRVLNTLEYPLENQWPEGVKVLRRAQNELSDTERKMMLRLINAFIDEVEEEAAKKSKD